MNFLSNRFVYTQVNIDCKYIISDAVYFFKKKRKNLLTGKKENVNKKYGLLWNYRNVPDTENNKFYLVGIYEFNRNPVYIIQDNKSRIFILGEDGILDVKGG